ncbi:mechanosensitive ion channel family protein [Candidatus Woesearchaeota archaeon]|nr:mechanosensitive ion channel family protein [Candidatus Woesearchaeota archaeon]
MVEANFLINNEFILFFIALLFLIIGSYFLVDFLKRLIKRITEKTKNFDEPVLKGIINPTYLFINIVGLYLVLKILSVLDPYRMTIKKFFFIASVILFSIIISRIATILINKWLKVQKKFEKTPKLINKILTAIIYLVALLTILDFLNIQITPLIATLGLGGLAIGLALQTTLINFFAGIYIISDKPVGVGDYIEIEGNISGFVEDIGWRSTKIKTIPNCIIIVPNSKISESIIKNYSLPNEEILVLVECGVSYTSNLKKVEKVTLEVAKMIEKTIPGGVMEFMPYLRYHTFGDSNINFSVYLKVEGFANKHLIIHEFIKALKERYDKEKIEISWPVRKVYHAK